MSTELALSGNTSSDANGSVDGAAQEHKSGMLGGLGSSNALRQVTMILALAVCLALAVFVILIAQEPEYRPLGKMDTQEMIQVLDVLDKNKIDRKIEVDVVLVPENKYQEVKLLLSRAGVESSSKNDDYLSKDSGFGVSQRMEQARLKHSQEMNLARAIEELKRVSRAKVILALPKENVFARSASKPSATVVITTRRSGLGQEEIDSIVDIVASAVQGMDPSRVTVTDSSGRLLNSGSQDGASSRARREIEIAQAKENEYRNKIQSILIPILGPENFSSQVDVSMDFTAVEKTTKRFSPDQNAVRSEQTLETNSKGGGIGGIPGALTNQPPAASDIPQDATNAAASETGASGSLHREATRNFELDTTVSHTRQQVGTVNRVSVSVAVNFKSGVADENGQVDRVSRNDQEIANIRRLLEGAVGFNAARGDVLEVVSVPFMDQLVESAPKPEIWEQPWFMRTVKLALGALVVIVLIVTVIRPMFKRMVQPDGDKANDESSTGNELAEIEDQYAVDTLGMLNKSDSEYSYADDGSILIPDLHKDDDMIKAIRALVANEPELSTQVIKSWLQEDA
ncbi:flagellar basal body M-ring protein FliF [Parashewanella spongiae]|uniref:Flagellar M-ring protein n=1 Tax=Parashewanella spongiae TaxID=342950 RepID=A0A3A6UC32_9GAMM|nr:flagellar basal-body MS-ring/collar protein FliF [Parashewanella spongiae]MCL1076631.1 flagellar M-ring protein FliF [Parashewanella spongiae]RJY19584.1 flagellar basal body M-ring protein FliF [Parashewanella spongiae]